MKLSFLKSIVISNFKRLSFPFKMSYALTYKCNLRCKMCNIWKRQGIDSELGIKEIDNFFKRSSRFFWLGLTGGEPFLRQDLAEIIDIILFYCRNLDALHFSTNGQLKDRISDLARYIRRKNKRLRIVYTISIDGPPSLHDEIRGVEGAWRNAIASFKILKDIKLVKPQFGFTLSSHNIDKFQDTFMSLKDACPLLRFDDMTVNVFQRSSLYYGNTDMDELDGRRLSEEIKKILRIDKEGFSLNNFLRRSYLKLYLKYINTHKCPLRCQAFSSTCFLDPYGNLFPCTVYNKKLINIRDLKQDFTDLWDSDYAKSLSYECSHYMCPSCWSPCDAYSAIAGSLKEAWLFKKDF